MLNPLTPGRNVLDPHATLQECETVAALLHWGLEEGPQQVKAICWTWHNGYDAVLWTTHN